MLKKLQQNFQLSILHNKSAVEKNIISTKNLNAAQRLKIYQNSYHERLVNALRQDFPRLCESLGESAFASLIEDYSAHYPSHDYNLRYVGKNLSQFILSSDPAFKPYADLAAQEWMELDLDHGTESN